MTTLMWIQAGSCSGDTMSLLCAENPDFIEFLERRKVSLLWHPSLSTKTTTALQDDIDRIRHGRLDLNILCIEGSLMTGPNGTGMFDTFLGTPKVQIIRDLAEKADYVVAMGTCAAFGGMHAAPPNPTDCIGLQWTKDQPGGLLPADWHARSGQPVINIAGCPAHPHTMVQTLSHLLEGAPLELNKYNMPADYFSTMVHQGCTRNEYHEYDIEETEFGREGCLYYNLGCQGPLVPATCNTVLWNGQNSKTRAGVPCLGCVAPTFPQDNSLFKTEKVGPVPLTLPLGVERPRYLAYKGLARAAAPARIKNRQMKP